MLPYVIPITPRRYLFLPPIQKACPIPGSRGLYVASIIRGVNYNNMVLHLNQPQDPDERDAGNTEIIHCLKLLSFEIHLKVYGNSKTSTFSFLGFQKILVLLLFVCIILFYLGSLWSLPEICCSIMYPNENFR